MGGKVYIDFAQNGHGQSIVAPFSLRPLHGAPASCLPTWSEVTARLAPAGFTMTTLPKRFDKVADPLALVLRGGIDMVTAVARIEQGLGSEIIHDLRDRKKGFEEFAGPIKSNSGSGKPGRRPLAR